MSYTQLVQSYLQQIPKSLLDFELLHIKVRVPTQASSEFITNREQGDWAEDLLVRAFNHNDHGYVAVKYGKSEKRVTGEAGFDQFFNEYQEELATIGKRPDVLIFKLENYDQAWNYDISLKTRQELDVILINAVAGIEVRSSAFLFDRYSADVTQKLNISRNRIFELRDQILHTYQDVLQVKLGWTEILNSISEDTIGIIQFQSPGWRSGIRFKEASELIKEMKSHITAYQKRNHLSITPKVEDIKLIVKWVETYNIPHFYFQVFFDKIYGLPFTTILDFISDPANEGKKYFLEADVKNQNKTTIKINPTEGFVVADTVEMPNHISEIKELNRGRLLFYVTFEGGTAVLNWDSLLKNMLNNNYD